MSREAGISSTQSSEAGAKRTGGPKPNTRSEDWLPGSDEIGVGTPRGSRAQTDNAEY